MKRISSPEVVDATKEKVCAGILERNLFHPLDNIIQASLRPNH